jgi:enoyl-CoA hydratase
MSDYTTIRYEQEGRVVRLVLNRPRYRNAQSRRLLEELDAGFQQAATDDGVGVIVLCGEGDHFSAGHDLGTPDEMADRQARPYPEGVRGRFKRQWDLYIDMGLRWRNLPKPTVAAVQGYCIYGGWMIAAACDVIFAADDALFLPSNFQYFSVPWDISVRRAKAILFENRFVGAEEAQQLGFIYRVTPRADLMSEVMEYAQRVAANDPFQQRMMKLAINQAEDSQGFSQHIMGALAFYQLSSVGESDPDFALKKPEIRRRPGVQIALENYEREKMRRKTNQRG